MTMARRTEIPDWRDLRGEPADFWPLVEEGVLVVRTVEDGGVRVDVVMFACPCGCGDNLLLPIGPAPWRQGRPGWRMDLEARTLEPSVIVNGRCGSHFFLRSGRVEWC